MARVGYTCALRFLIPLALSSVSAVCLHAQTAPVTFPSAVRAATERYAAVRVSQEQVTAAALGIELVRTQYLPKADFLGQLNRGTRNNIFGMVLPQSTLPSISGPPLAENSMTSVWGSMTGFTASWEPFDFGQRRLQLEAAGAAKRHAEASVARTRFEVAAAAADSYLTALAAAQMLRVAEIQRRRAQVTMEIVSAQVKAELRPGLDVTRMQAEVTLAENQRIQAEQAIAMAKAVLSRFLNQAPATIELAEGKFLSDPPAALFSAERQAARHPAAREQAAAIEAQRAKESALDKSYYPRFNLQGSTYARGSGARPDFRMGGAFSGFGPNIVNWGAGLTVTFPALALPGLRAQRSIEAAHSRVEIQKLEQIKQDLTAALERTAAQLEGARRMAAQMPKLLESAQAAETQAQARYKAGLSTIVDVADAQRLLGQIEIDAALAKLAVWRALLAVATAEGDLDPFLKVVED